MTAEVTQVPGEPIIIIAYTEPWYPEKDTMQAGPLFAELETQFEGPIFRITDFRALNMTAGGMATALMMVTKRNVVGAIADPRVHLIMVGHDALVKIVRKSLAAGLYGEMPTPPVLVSTTEAGLAYAHTELAKYAKSKNG